MGANDVVRHVPTCPELVAMGLATEIYRGKKGGEQKFYAISDAGYRLLKSAMKENAEEAIASGETEWRQPPSRTDLGVREK